MNAIQLFMKLTQLSWRMTRNETPLKVFISTFGIRIIFQTVFFVWVAHVLGGDKWMRFALYGSILLPAIQLLLVDVFNVLKDEIDQQRLALLTVSSTRLIHILLGRTLAYVIKTLLIVLFTFFVLGLFLLHDVHTWIDFCAAAPVLVVFVISGYSVAIFLSAFNLRDSIAQMVPNLAFMVLTLLGDFNVPVSALPRTLQVISSVLPLRHAVDVFRDFMVDHVPYWSNPAFYEEIGLMTVYAVIGYTVYLGALRKVRKDPVGV